MTEIHFEQMKMVIENQNYPALMCCDAGTLPIEPRHLRSTLIMVEDSVQYYRDVDGKIDGAPTAGPDSFAGCGL